MRATTITANDFLLGRAVRPQGVLGRHSFKATLEGRSIEVVDENGESVKVEYGATADMRSCHAYVRDVGFIGGWQYPHKAMPFTYLVDCINRHILYFQSADLPKSYRRSE